uniref:Reticulon domain-containing protein n=1 Tax=Graphocephala atropunctata TaxID=36148 RepID=A0A1B6LTQ5_9HEMI
MEVLVMMRNVPTTQNRNQRAATARWWGRWRRARVVVVDEPPPDTGADDSWSETLERLVQRVAPQLPTLSANTRKAIVCTIALVLVWRLVLWVLELLVTGLCCLVAVLGLVCFLRPETGLWLLTQVLPPHLRAARISLARTLQSVRNAIDPPPATPCHRIILTALPEESEPSTLQSARDVINPSPATSCDHRSTVQAAA